LLDLFAGSGAVGIEALGRGAGEVVFVDHAPGALRALRQNLDLVGVDAGAGRVLRARLPSALPALRDFDLVFADPPYAWEGLERLPGMVLPWLAPGGELALEHSSRRPAPEGVPGLRHLEERAFGETHLSFYRVE
jgi:16S rRNA (guanine(966)-N(2))-methyltransferase RsmD